MLYSFFIKFDNKTLLSYLIVSNLSKTPLSYLNFSNSFNLNVSVFQLGPIRSVIKSLNSGFELISHLLCAIPLVLLLNFSGSSI